MFSLFFFAIAEFCLSQNVKKESVYSTHQPIGYVLAQLFLHVEQ